METDNIFILVKVLINYFSILIDCFFTNAW